MNRPNRTVVILGVTMLVVGLAGCQSSDRESADTTVTAAETPAPAPAQAPLPPPSDGGGALLNPDSATREQLLSIPGMDAATADAIITSRPHTTMLSVDRVLARKLNEQQRDSVYVRLFKPLDLNTATGEEIMLIPGVGPRMRHEFEEYRPYRSMEQFRREIGKYVNAEEVARFERYVMIR
ncbi:MAG: hypothetical protein ABR543_06025 [Gemmatimonadaceae bacterium]